MYLSNGGLQQACGNGYNTLKDSTNVQISANKKMITNKHIITESNRRSNSGNFQKEMLWNKTMDKRGFNQENLLGSSVTRIALYKVSSATRGRS